MEKKTDFLSTILAIFIIFFGKPVGGMVDPIYFLLPSAFIWLTWLSSNQKAYFSRSSNRNTVWVCVCFATKLETTAAQRPKKRIKIDIQMLILDATHRHQHSSNVYVIILNIRSVFILPKKFCLKVITWDVAPTVSLRTFRSGHKWRAVVSWLWRHIQDVSDFECWVLRRRQAVSHLRSVHCSLLHGHGMPCNVIRGNAKFAHIILAYICLTRILHNQ